MQLRAFFLLALVAGCSSASGPNDPRLHYTQPQPTTSPCRYDETAVEFTDGAATFSVCAPVGCGDADGCPIPETGTATIDCYRPAGVSTCRLRCASGETCPDGMVCVPSADSSLTACAYPDDVDAGL